MSTSGSGLVIDSYNKTHQRILNFLSRLSDEQLHWRLQPEHHTLAFHAWHVGRWADHLQAAVPGMTEELSRRLAPGVQIWLVENMARRWGFNAAMLGFDQTGMEMPDEIALRLPLPAKKELLDYVQRAFAQAETAMSAIDEEQFLSPEQAQPMTEGVRGSGLVGNTVTAHLIHDNRHLGMMECLLGLQGQAGTATR